MTTTEHLPWAGFLDLVFGQRCPARREPRRGRAYHGRCELVRGHDLDHALERGMDLERWSTESTDRAHPYPAVLEQLAADVRAALAPVEGASRDVLAGVADRLDALAWKEPLR